MAMNLDFHMEKVWARFIGPAGNPVEHPIEIRTNPITKRTSRISYSRTGEKEPGADVLPEPPPGVSDTTRCPFCRPQVRTRTPTLLHDIDPAQRLVNGESLLFPNLFPYGAYSAVSLFNNRHFVEIGTADVASYTDCFINCGNYLKKIIAYDPEAVFMAITQNHLPSAGGSLVHPHLQIQADRVPANFQRFLIKTAEIYYSRNKSMILSDYLHHEKSDRRRYIGKTGEWEWISAFAPEGFYEVWGILPRFTRLGQLTAYHWETLSQGVINAQRFYRSLNRNGYNLGILFNENESNRLEIRVVLMVRSNYAPWVRNDHTGFEVMLGDMATFNAPEETAALARRFWNHEKSDG